MSKKGPTDTVASRDRVSGLIGSSSNDSKTELVCSRLYLDSGIARGGRNARSRDRREREG